MSHKIKRTEESRRDLIRNYIIENDGCTKTEVINYMENKSPIHAGVVTTHKIISSLVDSGTVISKPDPKNSQIHHLHINDNYSIIYNELTKIQNTMDMMDEPISKIIKFKGPTPNDDKSLLKLLEDRNANPTNFDDLYNHFIYPYEESISMMLKILFVRISKMVLSEKDAQALRIRITELILRLTTQIFNITREKEYLNFNIWELKTLQLRSTKEFARKNKINIDLRNKIILRIMDFEKTFLT